MMSCVLDFFATFLWPFQRPELEVFQRRCKGGDKKYGHSEDWSLENQREVQEGRYISVGNSDEEEGIGRKKSIGCTYSESVLKCNL